MSRRKHILSAIFACALLGPGAVLAQAAAVPKIGVVNFDKLLQQSPQAVAAGKALDDQFAARQRDLQAKQNELKDRQAKLEKDSQVMGADERRNAESKYRDDARDLERRISEFQEDVNVRRNEVLGKAQREIVLEVQAFAKQNGYDLIIAGTNVVYAVPALDVTNQVLASLETSSKTKPVGKP